jgi:hypothetical protein
MLLAAVMRAFSRSILWATEAISSSPSMMAEDKERGREGKVLWVGEGFAGLLLTRGATGTGNATSENVRQFARNDRPLDLHQFRGFLGFSKEMK